MLTLYHAPRTRASRFIWLLEEIGEPYEITTVPIRDPAANMRFMAKYRHIHPHKKVPALQHNGETIFESSAIALYLTDAFPKADLGPQVGEPKRGAYLTWLAYYAGVMEPAFVTKSQGFTQTNAQTGWAPTDDILAYIAEALAKGPYLLGEEFSAADVIYGATFALFMGSPLLPGSERFKPYVDRLAARPAYARAQAKEAA